MTFSRNSMAAAIAGSLSLAVLTGCNTPAATQAPAASPSAAASAAASTTPGASPSAAASAAASTAPGASPAAAATPAPALSAPPASGKTVTVSGKVFDDEGALVDGAVITVKSLNDANAYSATAKTVNGNYVFNNIPEGVQVAITATKDKWTSRTKTEAFQASSNQRNDVDFNGAYFISKFPEIVSTTPAEDATGVDSSKLSYKLTLSEALDDTNRRRFEDMIRLLPANAAANNGIGATDLEDNTASNTVVPAGYDIRKGSLFLDDADTRATVTWNAAGTEATLAFNAPLASSSTDEAKYQLALILASGGSRAEDSDGNKLGTASSDSTNGTLILDAFKKTSLSGTTWATTHEDVSTFEVAEDRTDPKLTGVAVSKLANGTRIELTFSEPMAAFNGSAAGISDATISRNGLTGDVTPPTQNELSKFTFMVGEKVGDLKSLDLDGTVDNALSVDGLVEANLAVALDKNAAKKEFAILTGTNATLSVDPKDAKRVLLSLPSTTFFGPQLAEIKARVANITDPAGNNISSTDADDNLVTGSL